MVPSTDLRIPSDERLFKYFRFGLVAVLLLMYSFQFNTGLADNGDFTRVAGWFSSGPAGFETNWQPVGTPEWNLRFFRYWLPYWKLDFPLKASLFSSAILLWYPGVLFHAVLFKSPILYLPVVSLFPKALTLVFLWLVLGYIGKHSQVKTIPALTIGGPLILLFTTTDIAAYFNSFYQETASLVFLLFVLVSIIYIQTKPGPFGFLLSFFSVLFLATAKISHLYLPVLIFPFLFGLDTARRNLMRFMLLIAIFALLPLWVSWRFSGDVSQKQTDSYHSIFYGLLMLSDNPEAHLEKTGMSGAESCIGKHKFTPRGSRCVAKLEDELSYTKTLQIILSEPKLLVAGFQWTAGKMQNLSISYLGKYSIGDPMVRNDKALNFWSKLKFKFFPKGNTLAMVLLLFYLLFIGSILRVHEPFIQNLAKIGLLTSIACASEILVAFIGDGFREPEKHLLLANLAFDFALICTMTIVILRISPHLGRLFRRYYGSMIINRT